MNTWKLCGDNNDSKILCQWFKYSDTGSHKKLLDGEFSLSNLIEGTECFDLKGDKSFGNVKLNVNNFEIKNTVTFLDYIMGGCNINVHVAIDYTMSNASNNDPSLHYVDPKTMVN